MHADFSVELGRDDPALELPWRSADLHVRYFDLKNHPELVQQIPEAVAHPELGAFLSRINAAGFPLASAKCDAWSSGEVAPEEEIFGDRKFVSYIDLVFVDEADRCSFQKHEAFAKDLCRLLGRAPAIAATVELVIRHCHYHQEELVSGNQFEHISAQLQQSDAPMQQNVNESVNHRNAALQPSAFVDEGGEHNRNKRADSRTSEIETVASLNIADPYEQSGSKARFQSEAEFDLEAHSQSDPELQSQDELPLEDTVPLEGRPQPEDNVQRENETPSEGDVRSRDKVWTKNKLTAEEEIQSEGKRRKQDEDARASVTGFCLTAYVTGFGDGTDDSVRRWTIGLGLLQHALVQLSRHR